MKTQDYEKFCESTAIYPKDRELEYLVLGLTSEVGELAGKIKKIIRDKDGVSDVNDMDAGAKELSDIMWYVTRLSNFYNCTLEELMEVNYLKLSDRKERGVIGGSGDDR